MVEARLPGRPTSQYFSFPPFTPHCVLKHHKLIIKTVLFYLFEFVRDSVLGQDIVGKNAGEVQSEGDP